MNSGATSAAIFFGLCAALVGSGCDASDPAPDADESQLEGSTTDEEWAETEADSESPEGTEAEPLEPSAEPAGDLAAAPDTMAASWSCGLSCPLFTYPVGTGCSSSCGGSCPNMMLCEAIPAPDPEAKIWATPGAVNVPEGTLGTSRICWKPKNIVAPVWIRVRVNGGPGQLFSKESDNGTQCEDAPWIQGGNSYRFTVHTSNSDNAPALHSTLVTGWSVPGGGDTGDDAGDDGGLGCGGCQPGWDCHCLDQCWPSGNACP